MSRDVDRLRHVNFVLWEHFNKDEEMKAPVEP